MQDENKMTNEQKKRREKKCDENREEKERGRERVEKMDSAVNMKEKKTKVYIRVHKL